MSGAGDADQAAKDIPAPAKDDEPKAAAESSEKTDGEQKPPTPNLFDPTTASLVGSDAATRAAYQQGKQNLRIGGSGAVVTGSEFDQLVIGDVTHVYAAGVTRPDPGPVRSEELARIRASYVEVAGYETTLDMLRNRRLILLRGPAGTGRATTALHLLDELTNGRVFRLDHGVEVHSWQADDLETGRGYLHELPTSGATELTEVHLDRLSASLENKNCSCVLIVGHNFPLTSAVAGYVTNHSPPSFEQLLRRHVTWKMPAAEVEVRERLRSLADLTEIRETLGPAPHVAEVVDLAHLLVEHHQQTLSIDDVVARCATFIDNEVAGWFDDVRDTPPDQSGERALRLIGYRIALATLNRTSQHLVAEAGEKLGRLLICTSDPLREPGRPVFAAEHHWWLEASRGHVEQSDVAFGDATVSVALAAYDKDRMPVAVLGQVWRRHHNARAPLLRWLNELAEDPQPDVWVRAAQTAGLLCTLDFADVFHNLVDDWASDDDPRRRMVAAYAIEQAARGPEAGDAVREVISRWKRSEDVARRWTASAALGRSLGPIAVQDALDDLLALGTWPEDEISPLAGVAGQSIARLLTHGDVDPVTHRLLDWWRDRPQRRARDVILLATIKAANTKVGDLDDIEFFTSGAGRNRWPLLAGRSGWPLLLALRDEDPQLAAPFADLVWRTLDTARSRAAALEVVTQWIRCAEKDRSCLPVLVEFLRSLYSEPRLQHLVAGLRSQWHQPLAADVADYLQQGLVTSRNGVGAP
ncbi:MAG TPA: hypothetical protein VJT72_23595 [Pseudonocardiaceae bacterium]|nr:hypothetical protein [Pseudonocardiaceae bacterium]